MKIYVSKPIDYPGVIITGLIVKSCTLGLLVVPSYEENPDIYPDLYPPGLLEVPSYEDNPDIYPDLYPPGLLVVPSYEENPDIYPELYPPGISEYLS